MSPLSTFSAKAQTGIDLLDQSWEGLSRGTAYLFYGPARTGRVLLVLQVVRTGAEAGESTVLVSGKSPQELAAQASTIDFDLEAACRDRGVRLLRLPEALLSGVSDASIEKALRDLAGFIRRERPARIIIEDFTPFVRFSRFEALRPVIEQFLTDVAVESTLVFALGEPANARSEQIVSFLRSRVAGALHLGIDPDSQSSTARRLTLQPTLGSQESDREFSWDLIQLKRPVSIVSGDSVSSSNDGGWPTSIEGEPDVEVRPTPVEMMPPSSGEAPPADIRFFDPNDPLGPPPQIQDPFGSVRPTVSEFEHIHYVEGGVDLEEAPVSAPSSEHALPEAPVEFVPPEAEVAPEPVRSDRDVFVEAFDNAMDAHANQQTPFLAIALRLPTDASQEAFDGISGALRATVDTPAAVLTDAVSKKLIVLLPNSDKEASREVFRRMKEHVSASHPEVAVGVLPKLAAVVVLNGHPFTSGSAFLSYVFDSSQA